MATARGEEGSLLLGGVRLETLARDPRIATPSYVYDLDAIVAEARALHDAWGGAPHLVAYAVKANTAGPIVRALAAEGCGADVVSGAELRVALGCGIAAERIVFSGVAKTDDEIDAAICAGGDGASALGAARSTPDAGILAVQIESVEEIQRVEARGRALGRRARVAMRVNPAVAKTTIATHSHISTGHDEAKFGVPRDDVPAALALALRSPHIDFVGVSAHAGSQLTSPEGYLATARVVFDVARAARDRGAALRFVGTGGGFGIDYGAGCAASPADFVRATRAEQRAAGLDDLTLHVEPGRSLVGAHGVLVARVIQVKRSPYDAEGKGSAPERAWLLIDAGMNDLIRPALYQARHRIVPLEMPRTPLHSYRVVGPVCESSDDFGEHDDLADAGFVAILDAGAYGFTMASRYNGRPLPAEVFLRGGRVVALAPRAPNDAWVDERLAIGASAVE